MGKWQRVIPPVTPKNRNGKRAPSGGSPWWRHQRLGPRVLGVSLSNRQGWEGLWRGAGAPSSPVPLIHQKDRTQYLPTSSLQSKRDIYTSTDVNLRQEITNNRQAHNSDYRRTCHKKFLGSFFGCNMSVVLSLYPQVLETHPGRQHNILLLMKWSQLNFY